jgi:hypothetical protein
MGPFDREDWALVGNVPVGQPSGPKARVRRALSGCGTAGVRGAKPASDARPTVTAW